MSESMAPVRSLFLTRFRPHRPNSGATLRNWQNIKAMIDLGPVDVVSLGSDEQEDLPMGPLEWTAFSNSALRRDRTLHERLFDMLWRVRWNGHPLGRHYLHGAMKKRLGTLLAQQHYDLVVIEELPLAVYLPLLKHAGCTVIFDAHNVEGVLRNTLDEHRRGASAGNGAGVMRTLWQKLLARKLLREEKQAVRLADVVWACSGGDAQSLARLYGRQTGITVVPNTIDVGSYQRPTAIPPDQDWSSHPLTLMFPGNFAYFPNEDAALRLIREVLPAVRASMPEAQLILLGKNPTRAMHEAAASNGAVTITGAVEDIRPFFDQPCVVTVPIAFGGGTRLKILEAFAASRPVVSTRKGAEGLDATDGQHLLLRESAAEIAQAVIELWSSTAIRAEMVLQALHLVETRYSSSVTMNDIRASLTSLRTAPHSMGPGYYSDSGET